MAKFICESCRYSFNPKGADKIVPPRICPYCNRRESVVLEKSAQDLIDEFGN
ncbi:MAG: hypothetical protein AABW88_05025 [Nanoarchaeota archaeon]